MSVYKQYFKENAGREFPIYGYSPPPQGKWWLDDTTFETEDFRTVERYQEYRDCGFNILFLQGTASYEGGGWENSEAKAVVDRALQAGLEKFILVDQRIFDLSLIEGGIIGEGKRFASEDELDDFIRDCLKDYRHQKGFYGIQLRDEPFYPYLKTVGQLFRSVARVDSSVFVHCNLNPMHSAWLSYRICPPGKNLIDSYEKYLSTFLEETGTNHLMADIYPFYRTAEKHPIGIYYFAGLECVARVCKRYGVEMHIVIQSFGMRLRGKRHHYLPKECQMQYQKNVLMAFGVKQYSYFTYWTKQVNRTNGESFPDGEAMMNRKGEKTRTWYHVQKVNKEVTALAPLLWEFEYLANAFFYKVPFHTVTTYLDLVRGGELSQILGVQTDREVVMVTEQYDKRKDQYLHCVVNTADAKRYTWKYGKEKQLTQLTYDQKYNVADIYQNKKWSTVPITDGHLDLHLAPGEGVIVLPYKKES